MKAPSSAPPSRWPALLLALTAGLLAPNACYFGEQDVPLGGNLEDLSGGHGSADDTAVGGGAGGADASSASGNSTGEMPDGTEMRAPGIFHAR